MGKAMARGLLALTFVSFEAASQVCPGRSPWATTDVPSAHPFCTDITWMAQRGVTLGCSTLNATQRLYCLAQSVRRDQMAAYMYRLGNAQLPLAGATGQAMKWDGTKWASAGAMTSPAQGSDIVLSPNPIMAAGSIAADTAYLQRPGTCRAGSSIRTINADGSVVCEVDDSGSAHAIVQGGHAFNVPVVLGTPSTQPLDINVNRSRVMRYEPHASSPNLIGGHPENAIGVGVKGATIAGGGSSSAPNLALSFFSTVGGGEGNQTGSANSLSLGATIGGGWLNEARGSLSTVAGGGLNVASGEGAVIAGGHANEASGQLSIVPGGLGNRAEADFSVAVGRNARVLSHATGAFVFSDATDPGFISGVANEFVVAATGGIGLYTSKVGATYCRINPGGGSWNCSSSREVKRDFAPVDTRAALDKVASLSLSSWRFVNEPEGVRHLGPMAEDFRAAFGLGSDERSISSVDAQGVALAAIQGLNTKVEQRLRDKDAEIAALKSELAALRRVVGMSRVAE